MTTRRAALKTLAAALMAPVVQLRRAIPDERLMLSFCDPEPWRWAATKQPFGVGSLTYATDSRAMIRAELANRHEVGEMKLPPVTQTFNEHWKPVGRWEPLTPDLIRPAIARDWFPCPECGNRQVSLGDQYPDFNDPAVDSEIHRFRYDIDENSIGDKSCKTCGGMAYAGANVSRVLGVWHSSFALKRIAALPNVMVCRTSHCEDGILFRADGFEGVSLGVIKGAI